MVGQLLRLFKKPQLMLQSSKQFQRLSVVAGRVRFGQSVSHVLQVAQELCEISLSTVN